MFPARSAISLLLLAAALSAAAGAGSSSPTLAAPPTSIAHRTRLVLKDGSYQQVMSYKLTGDAVNGMVSYVSADRAGAQEDLPASLVDWPATQRWEHDHGPDANLNAAREAQKPKAPSVLSPELAAEEADRTARHAEVAPGLHLPDSGAIFALDYFRAAPELVPLLRRAAAISTRSTQPRRRPHRAQNPRPRPSCARHTQRRSLPSTRCTSTPPSSTSASAITTLPGGRAPSSSTLTASRPRRDEPYGGAATSRYGHRPAPTRSASVAARNVNSFTIPALGSRHQPDVIETNTKLLPGGHWMSVTPNEPLGFGEYALVEVLDDRSINTAVWDFGVHSNFGDNRDSSSNHRRSTHPLPRLPPRPVTPHTLSEDGLSKGITPENTCSKSLLASHTRYGGLLCPSQTQV